MSIQGIAIQINHKQALFDGELVHVAFKDEGRVSGATCHFSFKATQKQSKCKNVVIEGVNYLILEANPSNYIPEMWTFHAREVVVNGTS